MSLVLRFENAMLQSKLISYKTTKSLAMNNTFHSNTYIVICC